MRAPPVARPPHARLPAFLEPLVDGLADADAFELDARLRALVALEQRLDAQIGRLLRRVASERAYLATGCPNLETYARERLGVSPRKARALLRLERAGEGCPELARAYRGGRLSWVQAQTLVPLLLLDDAWRWRRAWVAWAQRVTVRRLEDDVERALLVREVDPQLWASSGGLPADERVEIADRQTGAQPRGEPEPHRMFWSVPAEVARLVRAVVCTVRRRIEARTGRLVTEGDALEAMLDHVIDAWGGRNPTLRKEWQVFERDGWRCTAPGCSSRRNLHDHHIVFRSAGGSDALENRTTLCAWHHLRGVHGGTVRCVGRAPHELRWELGVSKGRSPIGRYASGDLAC